MSKTLLVAGFVAIAALGVAAAVQRPGPASSSFAPPRSLDVGGRSGDIIIADVTRDGRLDLVTTRFPDPSAAIHVGDGRGSFTAAGRVDLPKGAGAIALGDVTGDGVVDLIVASRDDVREYVSAMPGDGKGRFTIAAGSPDVVASAFAFYKPALRLVDVNEDGRVDIVSANGRRNSLEILFGDGTGAFAIGPRVMLDNGDFHTFAIADVDGDRHLDVVSSSQGTGSDRVALRRGDGRGGFGDRIVLPPTRPDARVVGLVDVNGDARVDVVLAHAETPLLSVLVNTGSRTFAPAAASPYVTPAEVFEVAVVDVNDDRMPDVVAAVVDSRTRPYPGSLVVLHGDGRGFAPAPGSPITVGRGAYNLAVGDVNGDGKIDVATSSFEGDPVTLLLAATSSR